MKRILKKEDYFGKGVFELMHSYFFGIIKGMNIKNLVIS